MESHETTELSTGQTRIIMPKRLIIVEPLLVLYALFGFPLMFISQLYILEHLTDDLVAKEGWVNLSHPNLTFDLCKVNKSDPVIAFNDKVQAEAAYFGLISSIVSTIPALFVSVFLGAYSDKVGRRYAILPPLISGIAKTLCYVFVVMFNLSIWYLLIGSFIDGLGGYFTTLLMGCFAYIADTTPPEKRRFRITVLDLLLLLSASLGPLGAGIIVGKVGYLYSFAIITGGQVVVVIYAIFFIPETIQKDSSAKFFDVSHLKRLAKVFLVKDIASNRRFKLIVLLLSFFIADIPAFDFLMTIYLKNRPLCMQADMIGYYMATYLGASTILGMGVAWVLKFVLSDPWVAMVAGLAAVGKNVYIALVPSVLLIFFTPVFGMFSLLFIPTIRTLMSKLVTASEQGAVFGAIACTEILCVLLGTLIFNPIYAETQELLTGFAFIAMAIFCLVGCGIMLIYIIQECLEKNKQPYNLLVQSTDVPSNKTYHRNETPEGEPQEPNDVVDPAF